MDISVSHSSVSQPFLCNTRRFIKTLWLTNTLPEKCDYNSDNRNGDRCEDRALFLVREAWGNVVSYEGDDSQVKSQEHRGVKVCAWCRCGLSAVTGGSRSGCGAREASSIDAPGVGRIWCTRFDEGGA